MPLKTSGFEGYSSKRLSARTRPWDKAGGRPSRPFDKWGDPVSPKFFIAFRASVCSKNKGGGRPPGLLPLFPPAAMLLSVCLQTSLTCFPGKNPNWQKANQVGNFKRGPGFEQIQLMIGVRPATQDKESSVEITRCPYWYVSKGRGRKGEGKRDPPLFLSQFSWTRLPLLLFCGCHAGYLATPQGFIL